MIKGIVNKNSNGFYICVNTLFHNISYLSNSYILNNNTVINIITLNIGLTLQVIYFAKL